MTKGDAIRAEIERRFPCMAMPFGAQWEMAEKHGVSREYVRQIAVKVGAHAVRHKNVERRLCGSCGRDTTAKNGICQKCRWVDIPCASCGALLHRRANRIVVNTRKANAMGSTAAGNVFCNQSCKGRWLGMNYGGGRPKARAS